MVTRGVSRPRWLPESVFRRRGHHTDERVGARAYHRRRHLIIAAIGMAVGVGLYWLSVITTGLILVVLVVMERWEHYVHSGVESRIIRLKLSVIAEDIEGYREVLARHHIHLSNVYVEYDYMEPVTRLNLVVLVRERTDYMKLFAELRDVKPTIAISLGTQVSI